MWIEINGLLIMDKRKTTPPNDVVNPQPTTPRRVLDVSSMDDVYSSVLADIQHPDTCTVEALLNGLLSLCLAEEHKQNPPADLLGRCIDAVLPICNAPDLQNQEKGKQERDEEEARADRSGLRTNLTK
jgi:hypothetical protein